MHPVREPQQRAGHSALPAADPTTLFRDAVEHAAQAAIASLSRGLQQEGDERVLAQHWGRIVERWKDGLVGDGRRPPRKAGVVDRFLAQRPDAQVIVLANIERAGRDMVHA